VVLKRGLFEFGLFFFGSGHGGLALFLATKERAPRGGF